MVPARSSSSGEVTGTPHNRPLDLSHIDTWVFDLDNTLYPATANLFPQIDVRMKAFISDLLNIDQDDAYRLQKTYYREHGTTLRGLMIHHNVDADAFLDYVHDIDHTVLAPDPHLGAIIDDLPGRKLVYTNGSAGHAHSVLEALCIADQFEAVFDIRAGGYIPKPDPDSYRKFLESHAFEPDSAIMFEDSVKNLKPAADMGMVTVLVTHDSILDDISDAEHCHYITGDLKQWLKEVVDSNGAA